MVSSHQLNPKNDDLVLLVKTILRHGNCFLSSVAMLWTARIEMD